MWMNGELIARSSEATVSLKPHCFRSSTSAGAGPVALGVPTIGVATAAALLACGTLSAFAQSAPGTEPTTKGVQPRRNWFKTRADRAPPSQPNPVPSTPSTPGNPSEAQKKLDTPGQVGGTK